MPETRLDEDKFQQVIVNLLDNACKYSQEGKTITITTSYCDSDSILIKIQDDGVGIKEEDKDKIFEKFIRLENHLTSKTQGNGLGLYITKNLVESMNGKIGVNPLDIGTEFWLEFPFYSQEEALQCSRQS